MIIISINIVFAEMTFILCFNRIQSLFRLCSTKYMSVLLCCDDLVISLSLNYLFVKK